MVRLPSTLALAGWCGFILTSIALASVGAAGPVDEPDAAPADVAATLVHAAALAWHVGCALALGAALYCLHGAGRERRIFGESLGFAALSALAVLGGLGLLAGSDAILPQSGHAGYWAMLALAALAILFDRLIAVDGSLAVDDEDFEAAVAVIAHSMARQTELYSRTADLSPPANR